MTCEHGYLGACAECDGAGQQPPRDLEPGEPSIGYVEPSLTVEIRRTGESEGVRIVTGGGAVAELARSSVEYYCRMLSGGTPPAELVATPPDNEMAEGHYEVEAFRGAEPSSMGSAAVHGDADAAPRQKAIAFLTELGGEIATQDGMNSPKGASHLTAWPVYIVEEKRGRGHQPVRGAVALTRRGIEEHIQLNGHNYDGPRVYVASMHRVPEMQELCTALRVLAGFPADVGESRRRAAAEGTEVGLPDRRRPPGSPMRQEGRGDRG